MTSARTLHEAGVCVLAGTDANNAPGRACPVVHGASMHAELPLLVSAGLTPVEALVAATSSPAERFGLTDRGTIAVGRRADLLMVHGDPTADITDTRAIDAIWREGVQFDRARLLTGVGGTR
jgi:imidazolonepropionase-like amidohydrolase